MSDKENFICAGIPKEYQPAAILLYNMSIKAYLYSYEAEGAERAKFRTLAKCMAIANRVLAGEKLDEIKD